ncbi:DUF1499 domain-containing protein [Desulfonatronum lacustre]|uniref:DUF1499 domain-containing protein n=1 Tax=Desulfonatronum lacustre TaxID=66849 RepID=UPI0004B42DC9|nr:DUF1499 domain-containing protein [Desulfonatronum lacustre]
MSHFPSGSRIKAVNKMTLLDCPTSPNCVSSQATNPARRVEPLPYPPGQEQLALKTLLQVLRDLPRTEITEQSPSLVKAVVQSALFRFKDDLEFHFDHEAAVIHIRSASRTGYWDLGANRRRVDRIRADFTALLAKMS